MSLYESKTEIVFEDLKRAYLDITQFRRFPRRFRIAFELYVYKSQQLTETMRSEYKYLTGEKWVASDFEGWDSYTAAVKKIRNATLHGNPLKLNEVTLTIYPISPAVAHNRPLSERFLARGYFAQRGGTLKNKPFQEEFVSAEFGLPLIDKPEADPRDKRNYLFAIKEFVGYKFDWKLLDLGLLSELGEDDDIDAVRLTLKTYPVYERYFHFYKNLAAVNMQEWLKPVKVKSNRKLLASLEFSDEEGVYIGEHHIQKLKQPSSV